MTAPDVPASVAQSAGADVEALIAELVRHDGVYGYQSQLACQAAEALREQQQEIARLSARVAALEGGRSLWMKSVQVEVDNAHIARRKSEAERDAAIKDAERWRFDCAGYARGKFVYPYWDRDYRTEKEQGADMDAIIAASKAKP